MKNISCLNGSWNDETNSAEMEAGLMKRILAKVEVGMMKNKYATMGKLIRMLKR